MAPNPPPTRSFTLLAFLHSMRSSNLRRNLRIFTSRSLLLWLRILGKLKKIWLWYFRTNSNGGKKKEEITGGHSSTRTLWKHEGYSTSVVCASRAYGGVGESSSMSESGIVQEPIELETRVGPSQSVSYSPSSSSAPSVQDSPPHSVSLLPTGSAHNSSSSLRAGSPVSFRELTIHRSSTPVSWTHPRAAATQFTGSSLHSRSRSPSPSRSLFHRRRAGHDTPERLDIDTSRPPVTVQDSSGSPETSTHSSSGIPVHVQPPSRAGTLDTGSPPQSPLSSISIHVRTQDLPAIPQVPSIEALNSSAVSLSPKWPGPLVYGTPGSARHRSGSIQSGSPTPQSGQGSQHSVTFPEPFASSISIQIPTNASGTQLGQHPITAPFPQSSTSPISIQTSVTNASGIQTAPPFPTPFLQPSISHVSIPVSPNNASGTQSGSGVRSWRPMHSEQVSRYVKKGDVPKKECRFRLPPMDVNLPHSYRYNQGLGDWVPFTHPGGALYFYHRSWRIFTDVYVYDPDLRAEVHEFARLLNEEVLKLHPNGPPFPTNNYDLVIDIVETKDKNLVWLYYFVDHNEKTLFWLENYDMSGLLNEIPGVREPGHIKHRLESLYWVHWSLYPVGYEGRKFPGAASKELQGILLSSSIDSLTSRVSTAPYSVADMETMRDIIKEAQDLGSDDAHAISSIARLLSICALWRFMHFHGQKTSRQDRNKSIYAGDCHKPTMLICLLSPVLFFAPDVHLRELKKVWADKLVIEEVWKKFMEQLVSEWVELVLYATVMLAANVGFLATQNISAPAEAASSISLVLSIGSIISGLLLVRRNRTMAAQDTRTAWDYLDCMNKRHFYLEPLAIIFSLTYALLMWSVCSFFIAVLISSFWKAKKNTWIAVAVSASLVAALIFWCIVNSWDSDDRGSEDPIDNLLNNTN